MYVYIYIHIYMYVHPSLLLCVVLHMLLHVLWCVARFSHVLHVSLLFCAVLHVLCLPHLPDTLFRTPKSAALVEQATHSSTSQLLPHNLHLTTSISRVPSTRLLHDMSRGGERHGVGSEFFHPLSIFSTSSILSCIPLCISLFHTYIHAHTHTHAHAHTHTLSLSHTNTHTHTRTCITMETCIYKCDGPDGVLAHVKTCLCTRQNPLHLPSPCIFHLEVHTPSPGVVADCDALHLL